MCDECDPIVSTLEDITIEESTLEDMIIEDSIVDNSLTHEAVGIAAGLDAMLEMDSVFEILVKITSVNGGLAPDEVVATTTEETS